jgi:hypothetical protein
MKRKSIMKKRLTIIKRIYSIKKTITYTELLCISTVVSMRKLSLTSINLLP